MPEAAEAHIIIVVHTALVWGMIVIELAVAWRSTAMSLNISTSPSGHVTEWPTHVTSLVHVSEILEHPSGLNSVKSIPILW